MERENDKRDEHLIDLGAISVETKGDNGQLQLDGVSSLRYAINGLSAD